MHGRSAESETSARELQRFYDAVAIDYDYETDLWTTHYANSVDEFLRQVIDEVPPHYLLDVGAGTGKHLVECSALGIQTVGVDRSQGMIRVARYRSSQFGFAPPLVQADGEALPFVNGKFDCVVCTGCVLNYCPDPEMAITELSRVLKKGGILVVGFDNPICLEFPIILLDAASHHRLRYDIRISDAVRRLSSRGQMLPYPYYESNGRVLSAQEKFLSYRAVAKMLEQHGIRLLLTRGVHILSCAVPFTVTSNPKSKPWALAVATRLCALDGPLRRLGGINRLAYHIMIEGRKI